MVINHGFMTKNQQKTTKKPNEPIKTNVKPTIVVDLRGTFRGVVVAMPKRKKRATSSWPHGFCHAGRLHLHVCLHLRGKWSSASRRDPQ